jgi:hypothetical protein
MAAPTTIAATVQRRPNASCVRSRSVNARPAKYTPASATSPNPTGTTPNVLIAQFAAKMVPIYPRTAGARHTASTRSLSLYPRRHLQGYAARVTACVRPPYQAPRLSHSSRTVSPRTRPGLPDVADDANAASDPAWQLGPMGRVSSRGERTLRALPERASTAQGGGDGR